MLILGGRTEAGPQEVGRRAARAQREPRFPQATLESPPGRRGERYMIRAGCAPPWIPRQGLSPWTLIVENEAHRTWAAAQRNFVRTTFLAKFPRVSHRTCDREVYYYEANAGMPESVAGPQEVGRRAARASKNHVFCAATLESPPGRRGERYTIKARGIKEFPGC